MEKIKCKLCDTFFHGRTFQIKKNVFAKSPNIRLPINQFKDKFKIANKSEKFLISTVPQSWSCTRVEKRSLLLAIT